MANFGDAIQAILTKGIDAVAAVKLEKLRVNDPTPYNVGPYGQGSVVGQAAYGVSTTVSALAPMLVIGGLALVAVLVLPRLFRGK